MSKFTAIDLFAGGGGVSVGLKEAGFKVVGALEFEKNAFQTYQANHPEVPTILGDIRKTSGRDFLKISDSPISLLVGCPPCQGFSKLTDKYVQKNPDDHDPRNLLVLEFSRLIEEISPQVFMMENVMGLATRGKPILDSFLNKVTHLGYSVSQGVLQAADYGVPQNRRRLVVLGGKGFSVSLPKPVYHRNGTGGLPPWNTINTVLKGMPPPITLSEANEKGNPATFGWHVIRNMTSETLKRLSAAKPGRSRQDFPDELRPKCHKGMANGYSNVYGRMKWNAVSPTITGGCTTFSKGRFGHPEAMRTISVREAALLQTFPPNYIFDTTYIDHVCRIIGNALPCDFAKYLAIQCRNSLEEAMEEA